MEIYASTEENNSPLGNLEQHQADSVELGECYPVPPLPSYYFKVRNGTDGQRVLLYKSGVVNKYLNGDEPFDLLIANRQREGRKLSSLTIAMTEIAEQHESNCKATLKNI